MGNSSYWNGQFWVSEDYSQKGEDATVLRIDSTRGLVFKNNLINTVLTATIFHGSRMITTIEDLHEVYGPEAYLEWSWQKMNENDFTIIPALDPRISQGGFALDVNPGDVDTKTVFMCKLEG